MLATSSGRRSVLRNEHENICAALGWTLGDEDGSREAPPTSAMTDADRLRLGVHLAQQAADNWPNSGRIDDGVYWLGRAIERGAGLRSADLALCHAQLATCLRYSGRRDGLIENAEEGLAILRRLGGPADALHLALRSRAAAEEVVGDYRVAMTFYEESRVKARLEGNLAQLHRTLNSEAGLVGVLGDFEEERRMEEESLEIAIQLDDMGAVLGCRQNLACTLRILGRLEEAESMMREVVAVSPALHQGFEMASLADDYAAILGGLGQDVTAMRLWGSAQQFYDNGTMKRSVFQWDEIADAVGSVRARVPADVWDAEVQTGRDIPLGVALSDAARAQGGGVGRGSG